MCVNPANSGIESSQRGCLAECLTNHRVQAHARCVDVSGERFAASDHGYPGDMHPSGHQTDDAVRLALAMVRAEWQDDPDAWNQLYAVCDDPAELARQLTHLCRQTLDQLAGVAGISSGEMLHRLAARLIPHPDPGHVTMFDLRGLDTGTRNISS